MILNDLAVFVGEQHQNLASGHHLYLTRVVGVGRVPTDNTKIRIQTLYVTNFSTKFSVATIRRKLRCT